MKWYGSFYNRMEEGKQFCDEIKVGTGVTEYYWSDRKPYEVIDVTDQKHVRVRAMKHHHVGEGCMDNSWKLESDPEGAERDLVKRGEVWYWTTTITADQINEIQEDDFDKWVRLAVGGWDVDKIREKGKQTKRWKANVSFGTAQYYYDYEF